MYLVWDNTIVGEFLSEAYDFGEVLAKVLAEPEGACIGKKFWFEKEYCIFFDTLDEAIEFFEEKTNVRRNN